MRRSRGKIPDQFWEPSGVGHASKIFESKGGYFSFFLFSSSGCAAVVFLGRAAVLPWEQLIVCMQRKSMTAYLSFQEQIGGQKMFKNWSEKIRDKSWDKYGKIGGRHGIRFAIQPPLTRKILKKLSQASREAAEIFFCGPRAIFL